MEDGDRLSRRDRVAVGGIAVLAFVAAAAALVYGVFTSIELFGEQATPRESSVADQAGLVMLWAVATPVCCWAVLRGERLGAPGVAAWLVLLGLCRWWWWPGPPEDAFDELTVPLWWSELGIPAWVLVGASLVVGLVAARRRGRSVWWGAVALTLAIVAGAAAAIVRLGSHARAEAPAALAEWPRELAPPSGPDAEATAGREALSSPAGS